MKYGIRANVYGGITGDRSAWCSTDGAPLLFDTFEIAAEDADRMEANIKKIPTNPDATFRYWAQEYQT